MSVCEVKLSHNCCRHITSLHHHGRQQFEGRLDLAGLITHGQGSIHTAHVSGQHTAHYILPYHSQLGQVSGSTHQDGLQTFKDLMSLQEEITKQYGQF